MTDLDALPETAPIAPHVTTVPITAQPVRLQLWGLTERELAIAAENVKTYSSYHSWNVVATEQRTGVPSPIRAADPQSLGQRAYYGWAWAAYPIRRDETCSA